MTLVVLRQYFSDIRKRREMYASIRAWERARGVA